MRLEREPSSLIRTNCYILLCLMVSHAMKITSGGLEALDTVLRRQAPSDLHLELVHKVEAIRLASDRGSKRAACQITLATTHTDT